MDITSYLLGKKSSGGGGGLDWSAIGYEGPPQYMANDYNYAKTIYNAWDVTTTDCSSKYASNNDVVLFPSVDASNVTNMNSMLKKCTNLREVGALNTSKVTTFQETFAYCSKLETTPQLDTSKATTFFQMFAYCTELKNVLEYDVSSISSNGLNQAFSECKKLTDESLNNILKMCSKATRISDKVLYPLFGSMYYAQTNYPASRIQALPYYQDFINAGWTIGY